MYKAYLIDPFEMKISGVTYNGDYKTIYKWLDTPYNTVSAFDVVYLNDKDDCVYVDDEGLLCDPSHFFILKGYPQPLAGKGLVLGTNGEGDSVSPKITLEELREMVTFGFNSEAIVRKSK